MGQAGPAAGAPIEHRGGNRTEAEPVGGTGRDDDPVERREHIRRVGDIGLEAEFDATYIHAAMRSAM